MTPDPSQMILEELLAWKARLVGHYQQGRALVEMRGQEWPMSVSLSANELLRQYADMLTALDAAIDAFTEEPTP